MGGILNIGLSILAAFNVLVDGHIALAKGVDANAYCAPNVIVQDVIEQLTETEIIDDPVSPVTFGDAISRFNVSLDAARSGVDIVIEENYFGSVSQHLEQLKKVPAYWLEDYNEQGWKYQIGNDFQETYKKDNSVAGLCHSGPNKIFCRLPTSTLHEFGHYMMIQLKNDNAVQQAFEEENDGLRNHMRSYAMTTFRECFADMVAMYLRGDNLILVRKEAPKFYQLVEEACLYEG